MDVGYYSSEINIIRDACSLNDICGWYRLIIPGLSEPPVRTLRFFRNYPFLPFYIIGNIV